MVLCNSLSISDDFVSIQKLKDKAMYADGVSEDKISQYAAIPVEEVKAILKT